MIRNFITIFILTLIVQNSFFSLAEKEILFSARGSYNIPIDLIRVSEKDQQSSASRDQPTVHINSQVSSFDSLRDKDKIREVYNNLLTFSSSAINEYFGNKFGLAFNPSGTTINIVEGQGKTLIIIENRSIVFEIKDINTLNQEISIVETSTYSYHHSSDIWIFESYLIQNDSKANNGSEIIQNLETFNPEVACNENKIQENFGSLMCEECPCVSGCTKKENAQEGWCYVSKIKIQIPGQNKGLPKSCERLKREGLIEKGSIISGARWWKICTK